MTADLLKSAATPPEDWPELVALDAPNLPRLDLVHLPGWAGDYVTQKTTRAAVANRPFFAQAKSILQG